MLYSSLSKILSSGVDASWDRGGPPFNIKLNDFQNPKVIDEAQPVRAVIAVPTLRHTSKEKMGGRPEMEMQGLHSAVWHITAEMSMLLATERQLIGVSFIHNDILVGLMILNQC